MDQSSVIRAGVRCATRRHKCSEGCHEAFSVTPGKARLGRRRGPSYQGTMIRGRWHFGWERGHGSTHQTRAAGGRTLPVTHTTAAPPSGHFEDMHNAINTHKISPRPPLTLSPFFIKTENSPETACPATRGRSYRLRTFGGNDSRGIALLRSWGSRRPRQRSARPHGRRALQEANVRIA